MRSKTILIVLFIFFTGMLTGWLTSRMAARYFLEKETRKPMKERLHNHVIRAIGPSSAQEKRIRGLMDEFVEEHQEMRKKHHKEMVESVDKLPEILAPELQPQQLENLKTELDKLKRRGRKGRKGGPPPPPRTE